MKISTCERTEWWFVLWEPKKNLMTYNITNIILLENFECQFVELTHREWLRILLQFCSNFLFFMYWTYISSSMHNLLLAVPSGRNSLRVSNLRQPCPLALLKTEFPSLAALQQSYERVAAKICFNINVSQTYIYRPTKQN